MFFLPTKANSEKKTSIKLIDMVDRYHLSSIILSKRPSKLRFYVKIQGLISHFCFTSCRLWKDMAMKTSYFKIANIDWLPILYLDQTTELSYGLFLVAGFSPPIAKKTIISYSSVPRPASEKFRRTQMTQIVLSLLWRPRSLHSQRNSNYDLTF